MRTIIIAMRLWERTSVVIYRFRTKLI